MKTILKVALGHHSRHRRPSRGQFKSVKQRTPETRVRRNFGQPEDAQAFEDAGVQGVTKGSTSSCIYYPEKGKGIGEGRSFQFCFANGRLDSKNSY